MEMINNREDVRQPYKTKDERASFLANIVKSNLGESILDVAGGDQLLKKYINPETRYVSIGLYDNEGTSRACDIFNLENLRCLAKISLMTRWLHRMFWNISTISTRYFRTL